MSVVELSFRIDVVDSQALLVGSLAAKLVLIGCPADWVEIEASFHAL